MVSETDVSRSRIFDGLTDRERQEWLAVSQTRDFRRGQVVVRQGEPAELFCLVESGFLKLVQLTVDGHEVIVRFVGPGEPFAGVVALQAGQYPVTALAVEATRLHTWSAPVLARLLESYPQVRTNIMREIATHMSEALTRVRELTTDRVGQRLAHTLLRLMRQCGRTTDQGTLIVHTLTRQELADLTGTTLYTVSRTLSQWEDDGVIRCAGRRIVIRSRTRLEDLTRATEP